MGLLFKRNSTLANRQQEKGLMDLEICVEVLAAQNIMSHFRWWWEVDQSETVQFGNIVGLGRGEDWSAGES